VIPSIATIFLDINFRHWLILVEKQIAMFAGGTSGWNPVDIYILMREKTLVYGNVTNYFMPRCNA